MTIAEQIKQFEATRAAKAARMAQIMDAAAEETRTLEDNEAEEYDALADELRSIDDHLTRLHQTEKANKAAARPVENGTGTGTEAGMQIRSNADVVMLTNKPPKGTGFVRYAMALAASKGNLVVAEKMAARWQESTPDVATVLRAAVAAGTTTDATWAAPLVEYQNLASEFIELLRPQTIIGKIPGIRRVPFNVKIPMQTAGSTVGWVGEGAPKPVGKLGFGTVTMPMTKAAGIVVLTDELVRSSSPSAEELVRADLTAAIAQFLDQQFIDPAVVAVAGVSPASITYSAPWVPASGTDADAARTDIAALFGLVTADNAVLNSGVWIMPPAAALSMSMMTNAIGQPEFPGMTINGGTFFGLPVVISSSLPDGDPDGSLIVLANASDILLADDGGVTLDVSTEASLQMDSAPAAGATALVSLWQNNMVGLRAERFINWQKRRLSAVAYINGANYA